MKKLIKEIYHFLTLKVLFPLQYKRYAKKETVKNKAVFIEANLSKLSNSLSLIYKELDKQGFQLHTHCLQEAYVGKIQYIKNAFACLKNIATAQYIFLCEGSRLISCLNMRKETVVVQTWHGCGAFKKFGFSTIGFLFGASKRESEKYSYYKNYDLVTVSSEEVIWAYKEAMNIPETSEVVKPLGVSRTDIFFDKDFLKKAKENVYNTAKIEKDKKIILYAPTFRGNVGSAQAPDALDLYEMKKQLGDEYVLLIKHHPVIKNIPEIKADLQSFAKNICDDLSIEELLVASDVCISDYSSIVFEYSLFLRPMVFFAYDFDEYTDWRGFYYDYDSLTPGPVVKTTKEIVDYIKNIEQNFDKEQVLKFKEKFMRSCDGKSTQRIIDFALNAYKERE